MVPSFRRPLLIYSDNVYMLGPSASQLRRRAAEVTRTFESLHLSFSPDSLEVLDNVRARDTSPVWEVAGHEFRQVERFTVFGVCLHRV